MTKHKPIYKLQVQYGKTGGEPQSLKLSAPFTRWFDSDGYFVATPFQRWLASEIPLVGETDPQKVDKSSTGKEFDKVIEPQETHEPTMLAKGPVDSIVSPAARSRKPKKVS